MNKELFFDTLIFMDLDNVSFMVQAIPVITVNDPFFMKVNVLAPSFGYKRYRQNYKYEKAKL